MIECSIEPIGDSGKYVSVVITGYGGRIGMGGWKRDELKEIIAAIDLIKEQLTTAST